MQTFPDIQEVFFNKYVLDCQNADKLENLHLILKLPLYSQQFSSWFRLYLNPIICIGSQPSIYIAILNWQFEVFLFAFNIH